VDAATEVFIRQGYRGTQMEDVARALGLAKGTLYGYVESKEALFDLALRTADGREPLPEQSKLPVSTPKPGATVEAMRSRLAAEVSDLELVAALMRPKPTNAADELTAVVRDLYARMHRNRQAIKLVDRCALDQPELAKIWFGEGRWAQHSALVAYFDQRIGQGHFRAVPSTQVAARTLLETLAFWAVHRHWDPSPQEVAEEAILATIVDLAVQTLVKEPS
jgi:AcrR family transcriptional regulator